MIQIPAAVSEKMSETGGTQSELLQNVVDSSSSLDRWTVFTRETLQNSNDQRIPELNGISCGYHYYELDDQATKFVASLINQNGPHLADARIRIPSDSKNLPLLVIADSGTKGLGGEIDPQTASPTSNFCNFFFFSGQLQTRRTGGGTYGIGRNVLFMASKRRTILVYSQIVEGGRQEKRFMAMATGSGFSYESVNFTGRHWWGETATDSPRAIRPVTGEQAEKIAELLGMKRFLDRATGTVIAVVDPDFEDPKRQLQEISDALLVNAWPRLLDFKSHKPSIEATITYHGEEIEILNPLSDRSPVKPFAEAYLSDSSSSKVHEKDLVFSGSIEPLREFQVDDDKVLGKLSWLKREVENPSEFDHLEAKGLPKGSSIALMRSARMVVRYERVDNPPDGYTVFGTFTGADNFEQVYRKAENATHDEWQANRLRLPSGTRNPILQVNDKILAEFRSIRAFTQTSADDVEVPITVANALGRLVSGLGVTGGLPDSTSGGTGGGRRGSGGGTRSRFKFELKAAPELLSADEEYCTGRFQFGISMSGVQSAERAIRPLVRIWLGDGYETEPPVGEQAPEITKVEIIRNGESTEIVGVISGSDLLDGDVVSVQIKYPRAVQITCELKVESE
jgi:hypothetical protein